MNQKTLTPRLDAIVHTPGPWLAMQPTDDECSAYVYGPTAMHRPVCEVFGWEDYRADNGWCKRRNAALIAAAPALAEALRMLYDFQNGPPLEKYRDQWNEAMAMAKAALAKAGNL